MLSLEKNALREITSANYITSVNGMLHPDRILPEHDFLYMLDGDWEVLEEDRIYKMHRDDLLILKAGRRHRGEKLCNPGNRHMYFHVMAAPIETGTVQSMEDVESDSLFQCHTLLHCQNHPRIKRYFQELISAFWSSSAERNNRLSLLFNLLLCEIAELQTTPPDSPCMDSLVEDIIQKLHSHPQISYTAGEMADAHYICPRTLNNRFQKAYGKTFYTFQMETKLEMVRHFLTHQPDATLHEAALNFGFYDEFHLSRAFKKQFGMSPSQFRKEAGIAPNKNFIS